MYNYKVIKITWRLKISFASKYHIIDDINEEIKKEKLQELNKKKIDMSLLDDD